jgi:hypothetical protein
MTKAKERRAYEQKIRVDAATVAIHGKIANLKEGQFYPAHDKRTESPEYKKVHKDLVVTNDLPCLVCGVRNSTLKNKSKNPHGAKQLEPITTLSNGRSPTRSIPASSTTPFDQISPTSTRTTRSMPMT